MTMESSVTTRAIEAFAESFYDADPAFRDLMAESLGPDVLAWARPMLEDMGRLSAQVLPPLSEAANQNPPQLVQYDAHGERIDQVRVHPSYREMTRLAYGAGLGGMYYDRALRDRVGHVPHSLVFGLGYLFAQAEQGLYCPICMTEGAARIVEQFGDETLKARFLPGLTSRDLDTLLEGAMFLTEKQGGSDVGANETIARQEGDHWQLYGDKWFCSNAGEAGVMMVLARPEGAPAGTKGLGLFLMPRDWEGKRNQFKINRLKDKLGTRSMPSGEFTLEGARAYAVGDVTKGFPYMTEMLNLSRVYNAVASLACMRRAYAEALHHSTQRSAFGKVIETYPMVRKTLVELDVELEASQALVWEAIRLLDCQDLGEGDTSNRALLRVLTPFIKFHTGKQAVRFASEACEFLGGNGYIETFITPRLLRDAQVLPIWEGTTNILVLDVLRCLMREGSGPALIERLRSLVSAPEAAALTSWKVLLSSETDRLAVALTELMTQDETLVTMHLKTWSDRAIRLYEAALLLNQADRELTQHQTARKLAVLGMHVRRFITPVRFGEPGWCDERAPYDLFEAIAHHAPVSVDRVQTAIGQ